MVSTRWYGPTSPRGVRTALSHTQQYRGDDQPGIPGTANPQSAWPGAPISANRPPIAAVERGIT